ncbi:hypothetical protein P7C71_g6258, partial [Lecanoromycetidae sp. Uapishka_2]
MDEPYDFRKERRRRVGVQRADAEQRLAAYLAFFQEVVPDGLVAIHAPHEPSKGKSASPKREEIRLQTYSGKIFMSGLVGGLNKREIDETEQVAAGEAMNKNDYHDVEVFQEWNFFTAHEYLKFFTGEVKDGECVGDYRQDYVWYGPGTSGMDCDVASYYPQWEASPVREFLKAKWEMIPAEER